MQIKTGIFKKIGIVLIVISIVLFTLSAYQVSRGSSNSQNYLNAGQSINLSKEASSGDYISFYIIFNGPTTSLSAYMQSPSGKEYINEFNRYGNTTGSIIGNQQGLWYLHVKNTGTTNVTIEIDYQVVSYYVIATIFVGFVLLPIGIALIALHYYIIRREKKRQKKKFMDSI